MDPSLMTKFLPAMVMALLWCIPMIQPTGAIFTYPTEDDPHEATWLQWPHDYGWDPNHVARYEESWIQITQALHTGERVRIIVYDYNEEITVWDKLVARGVDMNQIDMYVYETDDVWVLDNGPRFVFDDFGDLVVEDWEFNGWVSD